jgi:hypothetical protein
MSEHDPSSSPHPRELSYSDLERLDAEQAREHRSERTSAGRRSRFPKDDRRSSAMLTDRERAERWPIG